MPKIGSKLSESTRLKMSVTRKGKKRPEITVPVSVRLWRKCNKQGPTHPILKTKCWEWTGAEFKGAGYGQIQVEGTPKRTHRVAWALSNGPIPKGLLVLHKCDNRRCIRPDHLFLGTQKDNVDDMVSKGRKVVSKGKYHSEVLKRVAARGDNHWTRRRSK